MVSHNYHNAEVMSGVLVITHAISKITEVFIYQTILFLIYGVFLHVVKL